MDFNDQRRMFINLETQPLVSSHHETLQNHLPQPSLHQVSSILIRNVF